MSAAVIMEPNETPPGPTAGEDIFARMMREAKTRELEERTRASVDIATSTAMHNVFDILELAEMIFLECRIYDLLINCQRVSKHWQAVITSSKRLQQALFFQPLEGYEISYCRDGTDDPGYFADDDPRGEDSDYFTLDDEEFKRTLPDEPLPTKDERRRWVEGERTLVFANPFMMGKRRSYYAPEMYLEEVKAYHERRCAAMSNQKASWRSMLACQPPLPRVAFSRIDDWGCPEITYCGGGLDGIGIEDMFLDNEWYRNTPNALKAMVPIVYAKHVVRKNYKKGELELKKYAFDWGFRP